MDLKKTKLFKVIASGNRSQILKVSRKYLKSGKDPNLRDPDTGGNILHHIVSHCDKFTEPELLSVVYNLAMADVEIDAQDYNGETALHCVVRQRGAYRILVALMRCGIDTSIQNSTGMTALDILVQDKPAGHEEMLHWYSKFSPGLWCALRQDKPDRNLIEKLVKSWCRLQTVKKGEVVYLKDVIAKDINKISIFRLLERYETTVEVCFTLLAGTGTGIRNRMKNGYVKHLDPNFVDLSHQLRYPDYPEAPQPLLAATWETNSFDAVSALMDLAPDTTVLYAPDKDLVPNPVIFYLLNSPYRPKELRTIHRVLESSDVSLRNHIGQTLLFQAVYTEEPLSTIKLLLAKGVNLGARDYLGRTARDFAEGLQRGKYVTEMDNHVIQAIKSKDFPQIERLLLEGYDHVCDVKDKAGKSAADIARKHSSPQVYEIVRLGEEIQLYVKRVFKAVDDGNLDDLQKLLACKKYAGGRDLCGRTPLMKAVLLGRNRLVLKLAADCAFTINMQDSLGKTVLHYAYLFMDDPEVLQFLENCGADPDQVDARGRVPDAYTRSVCGSSKFRLFQKEVLDADLEIYAYRTDFEKSFRAALKTADLAMIRLLISGLAEHGDISRFSPLMFECVDLCREDIAIFLLRAGFNPNVSKQYPKCSIRSPSCFRGVCDHSVTTLKQRAVETGCSRVVKLINQMAEYPQT